MSIVLSDAEKTFKNTVVVAIVNDAAAALLARAQVTDTAKIGLVLGTGINATIELPVAALSPEKFGVWPQSWAIDPPQNILVNTELGFFGKGILPTTRWDDQLNQNHISSDVQPLEYLIGGRYLGEIARLIIVDAVNIAGLLGGTIPPGILKPYSLETQVVADLES